MPIPTDRWNRAMRLKVTLEYDGRPFSGWQLQPGLLTVQGELERAFGLLAGSWSRAAGGAGELPRIEVTGSGRTDAGVHARGQVASLEWPDDVPVDLRRLARALNGVTHRSVSILSVEKVGPEFDARSTPHLKEYRYHLTLRHAPPALDASRTFRVDERIDLGAMIVAAHVFRGQHDFRAFRASDCTAKTTVRTLETSELTRISDHAVVYVVRGKGFLKQMVRIMVGALVEVGRGRLSANDLVRALEDGSRIAARTAPPDGLVLEWVRYDAPRLR